MGKGNETPAVWWGRSRVTGLAHSFWEDDDTVDADLSICGRTSALLVEKIWHVGTPGDACEGCALMLAKHGARLELPHHREAKASRRAQVDPQDDGADEAE